MASKDLGRRFRQFDPASRIDRLWGCELYFPADECHGSADMESLARLVPVVPPEPQKLTTAQASRNRQPDGRAVSAVAARHARTFETSLAGNRSRSRWRSESDCPARVSAPRNSVQYAAWGSAGAAAALCATTWRTGMSSLRSAWWCASRRSHRDIPGGNVERTTASYSPGCSASSSSIASSGETSPTTAETVLAPAPSNSAIARLAVRSAAAAASPAQREDAGRAGITSVTYVGSGSSVASRRTRSTSSGARGRTISYD